MHTEDIDSPVIEERKAVRAAARVIKARFNNLTVDETLDLAYDIYEAILAAAEGE